MTPSALSRFAVAAILPASLFAAAAFLNIPTFFGAHPFWAAQILWIGLVPGLLLALLLWHAGLSLISRAALTGALLIASGLVAHLGKARFAASFAEDRLAGRFWYFGWIAVALFAAAFLASLLLSNRRSASDS